MAAFIIIALQLFSPSAATLSPDGGGGADLCSAEQQRRILPGMLPCTLRPAVVPLPLPNGSYVHVAPRHVEVNRCGGSCQSRFHSCVAASTRIKSVDVMMVRLSTNAGATPSECAVAEVEEHTSCGCGCSMTQDDCSPAQVFMQQECRCACSDGAARADCLNAGRHWSSDSCSCMCRDPVTFPTCPSGYYFDSDSSCSCAPMGLGENASALLEIVLLVLTCCCLLLGYGSLQLLRRSRRTGMEKRKRTLGVQSLSELRALFISNPSSRNPSGEGAPSVTSGVGQDAVVMRPRAKTFSFFPLRGYEELSDDTDK